jgi:hypothetical protein
MTNGEENEFREGLLQGWGLFFERSQGRRCDANPGLYDSNPVGVATAATWQGLIFRIEFPEACFGLDDGAVSVVAAVVPSGGICRNVSKKDTAVWDNGGYL